MLRKISTIPIWIAMMMVTVATLVPHHHHDTMICVVKEICSIDGRCDDEHTHHNDADHDGDESRCVAHEQYSFTDSIRIEKPVPKIISQFTAVDAGTLSVVTLYECVGTAFGVEPEQPPQIPSPPPLSSAAPNAPPLSV